MLQDLETQLEDQSQDLAVIVTIKQQLQDAQSRIQRMVSVHEKTVAERDEHARQVRATAVQLSHQRLTVAHLQRQVDRARRENMILRAEVRDLSSGRPPQVRPYELLLLEYGIKTLHTLCRLG